jgi:hypothetical protein
MNSQRGARRHAEVETGAQDDDERGERDGRRGRLKGKLSEAGVAEHDKRVVEEVDEGDREDDAWRVNRSVNAWRVRRAVAGDGPVPKCLATKKAQPKTGDRI